VKEHSTKEALTPLSALLSAFTPRQEWSESSLVTWPDPFAIYSNHFDNASAIPRFRETYHGSICKSSPLSSRFTKQFFRFCELCGLSLWSSICTSERSISVKLDVLTTCLPQLSSINRMSVYSNSPSFASTTSSETANGMAEINELAHGLNRLKDKRLEQQRFVQSAQKIDDLSKLALGAKLERALGRRMTEQDAVMRVKPRKPSRPLFDEKAEMAKRQVSAA